MTEILTESFCERCGTRYTFESRRPRVRLKGVKVLSRGLKNFVLSDDTSIDEAMAAARSEADREASAHQLDAFHKTFNFCMSCRQYTCPNCWNEAEARCLSCAPLAVPEASAAVDDLRALRDAVLIAEATPAAGTLETPVWQADEPSPMAVDPSTTWLPAPEAGDGELVAAAEAPTQDELVAETGATPDVAASDELVAAAEAEASSDGADHAGKAVSQTLGLLRRFRPGQSLDAELDAYEREREDAATLEARAETDGLAEPVGATDDLAALQADRQADASSRAEPEIAETELVQPQDTEPEPAVAEAVAFAPAEEPAPIVADAEEPSPALAPEPIASSAPAAAPADVVEQPTWRITALDPTGATPVTPTADPVGPVPLQASAAPAQPTSGDPQWPARPQWPAASGAAGLPFLGRPAAPQGGIDALWAASNQELVATPPAPGKAANGIQPCISCGLSLSATARFCRRCGTLQGR